MGNAFFHLFDDEELVIGYEVILFTNVITLKSVGVIHL